VSAEALFNAKGPKITRAGVIAPVTSREIAELWRNCGCPPRCGGVPARWPLHRGRFTSGRHLSSTRIMLDRLLHYLAQIIPSQDEKEANMVVTVLACIVPASASTSRTPWVEVGTILHQSQLLLNITCFINTVAIEYSTHVFAHSKRSSPPAICAYPISNRRRWKEIIHTNQSLRQCVVELQWPSHVPV
jgi:hypothetical protein